jgi:CubicO group peptidase (beta-lactamase class C family)
MKLRSFLRASLLGVAFFTVPHLVTAQDGAAIDAVLRAAVERKDVPGVVALVTNRDRVLYQGAFGVADVSTGRELTADALFRIASMTKPITSLALLQLVEQGKLASMIRPKNICPSLRA